jgi:alkanesulfonate monooxygenase SsuD/methylene tetrahydromethanopterin reductase-like flavin-dependent oxidoreductase (luciferase family)
MDCCLGAAPIIFSIKKKIHLLEKIMPELARPVGIGFAARGKVSDVVGWAEDARRRGVHSVWIHDSLYERDAVTYASAIASHVPDIRVAMGALSTYTRVPALISMTVSALDEMAPGRIILGLGTAIPLRLAQMGIPYTPDAGVESVSNAIDLLRTMWSGQRIPSATPNLPPIQPMYCCLPNSLPAIGRTKSGWLPGAPCRVHSKHGALDLKITQSCCGCRAG